MLISDVDDPKYCYYCSVWKLFWGDIEVLLGVLGFIQENW